MDGIATFELGQWVERYKATTKYDLSGSAAPPLSIDDLIALSTDPQRTRSALQFNSVKLGYSEHHGSDQVRENIAALYGAAERTVTKDHVLITNGASGANQIILQALVGAGGHVICVYPTYGQLLEVPRAVGIEVSPWRLDPGDHWSLSFDALKALIQPSTKMIIVNNPNNPTGTFISNELQGKIMELAEAHDFTVFSDEVFRPLFHSSTDGTIPKSILEWGYDKTIVSGSSSKAYGLPGTRVGWIASTNESLIQKCAKMRDYSIGYTNRIADAIFAEAISQRCRPQILATNHKIAKTNLDRLEAFIKAHEDVISWTRPTASSITLLKFVTGDGRPVDDVQFCIKLQKETGVLFAPASLCFGLERQEDFNGYVRCQFLKDPNVLQDALTQLGKFIGTDSYRSIRAA